MAGSQTETRTALRIARHQPNRHPGGQITAVITVTLGLAGVATAGELPAAADLAENLKATEQAFAKTMADRDHAAFASFLAEEAVFLSGRGETRGKAAIAAAWKPF